MFGLPETRPTTSPTTLSIPSQGPRAGSLERGVPSCEVLASAEDAIAAIGRGEVIVVVDDEDRENEGDLVAAADLVTPEMINFMITHARGLVCTPITPELALELELPPMVAVNEDHHSTAFTVSVDGGPDQGVTTGISAGDRAATIRLMLHGTARDLRRPGHVFPLVARPGGVLERPGHTEAGVDLARLAGLRPAGVIVEIIKPDGEMARLPYLVDFAAEHGLLITSIEKLIEHRRAMSDADAVVGLGPVVVGVAA